MAALLGTGLFLAVGGATLTSYLVLAAQEARTREAEAEKRALAERALRAEERAEAADVLTARLLARSMGDYEGPLPPH